MNIPGMAYDIYYILGGLLVLYLLLSIFNKRKAGRRKHRKFMEGYNRRGRDRKKEGDKKQ